MAKLIIAFCHLRRKCIGTTNMQFNYFNITHVMKCVSDPLLVATLIFIVCRIFTLQSSLLVYPNRYHIRVCAATQLCAVLYMRVCIVGSNDLRNCVFRNTGKRTEGTHLWSIFFFSLHTAVKTKCKSILHLYKHICSWFWLTCKKYNIRLFHECKKYIYQYNHSIKIFQIIIYSRVRWK
jgi:hypothetical protein